MSTTTPLEVGGDDTDTHYLVTGMEEIAELERLDLVDGTAKWAISAPAVEQVVVESGESSRAMAFVYAGLLNLVAVLALAAYLALG